VPFALVFTMMEDGRKLFAHDAYFDYADRANSRVEQETKRLQANRAPLFVRAMWDAYRSKYPSTYDKEKWDADKIIEQCTQPKE